MTFPLFRAWDNNGNPAAGFKLNTFQAGTTTPTTTWTDTTEGTPNANPVVLNARGEAPVWTAPTQLYKFQLTDAAGNVQWTVDQVPGGYISAFAPSGNLAFSIATSTYVIGNTTDLPTIQFQATAVQARGPTAAALLDMTPDQGTFTLTFSTGISGSPTGTAIWRRLGQFIALDIPSVTGTGTGTTCQATGLPAAITPVNSKIVALASGVFQDNGARLTTAIVTVTNGNALNFANGTGAALVATGTRGTASGTTILYSLT